MAVKERTLPFDAVDVTYAPLVVDILNDRAALGPWRYGLDDASTPDKLRIMVTGPFARNSIPEDMVTRLDLLVQGIILGLKHAEKQKEMR